MFSYPSDRSLPPDLQAHARLIGEARARAQRLRSEAIRDFGTHAWDDVWRGANAVWHRMQSGQAAAARSTTRLHTRLTRHQAQRAADGACCSHTPTTNTTQGA
jgi:hypothetical protein